MVELQRVCQDLREFGVHQGLRAQSGHLERKERRGTPAIIVLELGYQGHLVFLALLENQATMVDQVLKVIQAMQDLVVQMEHQVALVIGDLQVSLDKRGNHPTITIQALKGKRGSQDHLGGLAGMAPLEFLDS